MLLRETMFTCTVEMFGMPEDITSQPNVEVELNDGVGLTDVVAALRRKVPALEGLVICHGRDQLLEQFGFYINGRCYTSDEDVRLKTGDRVVLLALATGG